MILSASFIAIEEEKLLRVLRNHKDAIVWSLVNLKGIHPSMCMHRILLEDGHKPSMEAQRRLNPTMKGSGKERSIEVVRCKCNLPHFR